MSLHAETWLILRNDFRLLWRDLRNSRLRAFSRLPLLLLLFLGYQAVVIMVFIGLKHPPPLVVETIAWFFAGFLMLASSMNNAVTVLFERADFDLLLSSPVSPRAILLARLAAMASASALAVAFFFVPLINALIIGVNWRYAFAYPAWVAEALAVTSVGVWLTLALVRWLGPRRARIWTQVIAALLGAVMYIGFQVQNSLGHEVQGRLARITAELFDNAIPAQIAQAGRGHLLPLLGLLVVAIAMAGITTRILGRIFVHGIQESAAFRSKPRRRREFRFAEGIARATFWKDVRLIIRDPLLLSRVLPSVFYLIPALFPLNRIGHLGAPGLLAPFSVIAAVMLSSQLTAVAAAGEEGWDLIRLSPASTATLRYAKIGAGMALPMALAFVIAIVVVILGRPGLAAFGFGMAAICSGGSSWLEVAIMRPTPRKDLIQRTARRSRLSPGRIVAGLVFIGVGTAGVAFAAHSYWLLALVALGVVLLTALGCFTLIAMEDIEFESTTSRLADYDAGKV